MNKLLLFMLILSMITIVQAEDATLAGSAELTDTTNQLLDTTSNRLTMIIPAILVIISLIFFSVDFGAVGVIIFCELGLVTTVLVGLVEISYPPLIAFVVMGAILAYKISD